MAEKGPIRGNFVLSIRNLSTNESSIELQIQALEFGRGIMFISEFLEASNLCKA
jgi:hypothetical protein